MTLALYNYGQSDVDEMTRPLITEVYQHKMNRFIQFNFEDYFLL